jgi:hypothetical protein
MDESADMSIDEEVPELNPEEQAAMDQDEQQLPETTEMEEGEVADAGPDDASLATQGGTRAGPFQQMRASIRGRLDIGRGSYDVAAAAAKFSVGRGRASSSDQEQPFP